MNNTIKEYFEETILEIKNSWEKCVEKESTKTEDLLFRSWVISRLAELEMMIDMLVYKFLNDENKTED